ncbi:MAG: hypothetical protein U0T56_11395 [Ferruginibacter sp.]
MPNIAIRPRTADEISRIAVPLFQEGMQFRRAGRNRPEWRRAGTSGWGGHFF